ncbi:MAG: hypothetical protein VKJ85_13845 [Prochlorothrix sp.]|nr:hypothetical protein [Prochlorothrix sp.]
MSLERSRSIVNAIPAPPIPSPAPLAPQSDSQQPQQLAQQLVQHIHTHCWITYTPTAFNPQTTPLTWPSIASVRADFAALRQIGVEGLVTYRAFFYAASDAPSDRSVPQRLPLVELAAAAGFEAMIIGIWNPSNEAELRAAERLGSHPLVWGYSVGNEGLNQRYDRSTLLAALNRLRQATGKPVATTEETPDYFRYPALNTTGDWIFANVHPYFTGIRDPDRAVAWTDRLYFLFRQLGTGSDALPVVFKEVGLPTAGAAKVSEARQAQYYQALSQTKVTYVNFAAFDLPWKSDTGQAPMQTPDPELVPPRDQTSDLTLGQALNQAQAHAQNLEDTQALTDHQVLEDNPEPYWGVFRADRSPKPAAEHLCDRSSR